MSWTRGVEDVLSRWGTLLDELRRQGNSTCGGQGRFLEGGGQKEQLLGRGEETVRGLRGGRVSWKALRVTRKAISVVLRLDTCQDGKLTVLMGRSHASRLLYLMIGSHTNTRG